MSNLRSSPRQRTSYLPFGHAHSPARGDADLDRPPSIAVNANEHVHAPPPARGHADLTRSREQSPPSINVDANEDNEFCAQRLLRATANIA